MHPGDEVCARPMEQLRGLPARQPAQSAHDHAPLFAYRRRGPRRRPDAAGGCGAARAAEPRVRGALGAGVPRPASVAAATARRGAVVRRGVPAAQHALRAAGVSADPLHLEPGLLSRRQALHPRRRLSHRPLERRRTAEGDGAARGATAGPRRRHAVRQHASRLRGPARGDAAADRRTARDPRVPEPSQRAEADGAERDGAADGAGRGAASAGAHASRERPQVDLPQSDPHRGDRRDGGERRAGIAGRAAGARDAAAIRVPPPVAVRATW